MGNSNGKYALITGGSAGIGFELARQFAKSGYNLVLVARDNMELLKASQELTGQHGVQVTTLAKDLFDKNAPQEIYDQVKKQGLPIDVLVNNAGQGEYGFFEEVPLQRHLDIIQLNIVAPVALTRLFLTDMISRGEGKILNLASIVSKIPTPLIGVYSATKAFIYSFSQSLRNEVKDLNITVTALLPGSTDTDFFNKAGMLNTIEYHQHATGDPADVAKDGFEALMKGEDHVVSGMKNKMMTARANVTPDPVQAGNMREKHMRNIDGTEGKEGASESEGSHQAANNPATGKSGPRKPGDHKNVGPRH